MKARENKLQTSKNEILPVFSQKLCARGLKFIFSGIRNCVWF